MININSFTYLVLIIALQVFRNGLYGNVIFPEISLYNSANFNESITMSIESKSTWTMDSERM